MTLKVARRALVPPFIVMDVLRAANEREAAGEEVLHLEVGQPGTPAPAPVRAAAAAALESAKIGYTDALGLRSLRARIARSYAELYRVELDPARVVVTTGSSGGFLLSFLASFESGDRVALAAPGYPAYRNILASLGVEPVLLPCDLEHRFQPTAELLDRAALSALVDYCAARGLRLISDEIYHGIAYEAPAVSALELTDRAIVINSFSKYYSMTGWRLGWMVLPEDLLRPVECLAQNLFISPPTLSQIAAEAAFDCREELNGYVAAYARNRAVLLRELPKAGFDRLAPADGAFYLYADVGRLTNDSEDFCRRMLAETGVAITPGIDFDPERGHRFVRFSFAGLEAEMAQAAERLAVWLKA